VNGKISGTPYLTSPEEKSDFYKLLSYAFMSQGPMGHVVYINIKGGRLELAPNIHVFGIKLMQIKGKKVIIRDHDRTFVFDASYLWKFFLERITDLFPNAQAEALSKSKEMPKKDLRSIGFDFSADDKG